MKLQTKVSVLFLSLIFLLCAGSVFTVYLSLKQSFLQGDLYINEFQVQLDASSHQLEADTTARAFQTILASRLAEVNARAQTISAAPGPGEALKSGKLESLKRVQEMLYLSGANLSFQRIVNKNGKLLSNADPSVTTNVDISPNSLSTNATSTPFLTNISFKDPKDVLLWKPFEDDLKNALNGNPSANIALLPYSMYSLLSSNIRSSDDIFSKSTVTTNQPSGISKNNINTSPTTTQTSTAEGSKPATIPSSGSQKPSEPTNLNYKPVLVMVAMHPLRGPDLNIEGVLISALEIAKDSWLQTSWSENMREDASVALIYQKNNRLNFGKKLAQEIPLSDSDLDVLFQHDEQIIQTKSFTVVRYSLRNTKKDFIAALEVQLPFENSSSLSLSDTTELALEKHVLAEAIRIIGSWGVVILIAGILLSRTLVSDLLKIVHKTSHLLNGSYNESFDDIKRKDELGELAQKINSIRLNLYRESIEKLDKKAE